MRTPGAYRRTVPALLAALLGAALLLTGCGIDTGAAGAAVVVGDRTVPDSEVATQVSEVRAELGDRPFDAATVTTATVNRLTQRTLLDIAAQREDVVVTPTQVDELLTQNATGDGGMAGLEAALLEQYSVPSSQVRSYAETFLQQQALAAALDDGAGDGGSQALTDYMIGLSDELGTRVAPRYGTWESSRLSLGAAPTDLASPAS